VHDCGHLSFSFLAHDTIYAIACYMLSPFRHPSVTWVDQSKIVDLVSSRLTSSWNSKGNREQRRRLREG